MKSIKKKLPSKKKKNYMCWQSQLATVKKGAEDGRNKW
jgi:hypothetical protein